MLERRGIMKDHGAAAQGNPALSLPFLELFVHGLSRDAEEARQLFLRNPHGASAVPVLAMQLAQREKALGEARGRVEERRVLEQAAGPAQPLAAQPQELQCRPRFPLEQLEE